MSLLDNLVVLVTGGGRGVGRGIALEAARHGARVVVNDLGGGPAGGGQDAGPAATVAEEIKAAGGQAVASTESVASWDSAQRIVARALEAFGRIDVVVNNAGILKDSIFHKMTPEDFDAVLDVNLRGPFFISRAAAPYFKAQNSGSFIHMTSSSALIGNFGQANYCASKLGIVGLSKAIALDMQRFNVRSNCISPFAWTRMVGTIPTDTPEQKARVEGLKKMVPERIAPFAVALMSEAARDVTGQIFGVRNNEIYFFSQNRPAITAHAEAGWTPDSVIERVFPMMKPAFYPLVRSGEVFNWAPV
jgi:NAD(P)-dependent dehydrogenase (short-subunit alcohol dehydrogenase family)